MGTSPFGPTPRSGAADPRLSAAIDCARVISIMGMIYVHAWTGLGGWALSQAADTPQGVLRWLLIEFLGRGAVPLLGMVSGWLVAGSVLKRPYGEFLTGKARTILLPMVLWNAIAIVLVSGAAYAGLIAAPTPSSIMWVVNELTTLTRTAHIDVQMAFLRDLFVCMAFAPLLARLPGRALVVTAVGLAAWTIADVHFPLLLRPMIALFFVCGMLARRYDWANRVTAWPLAAILIPFALLVAARVWLAIYGWEISSAYPMAREAFIVSLRFVAALVFWRIAWSLAAGAGGRFVLRAEPYVFVTFCSHLIFMWLLGNAIGQVTGKLGAPLYPAFLIAQPFLCLGFAVLISRLLLWRTPWAADILSGGRLRRAPRHAAAARKGADAPAAAAPAARSEG